MVLAAGLEAQLYGRQGCLLLRGKGKTATGLDTKGANERALTGTMFAAEIRRDAGFDGRDARATPIIE